MLEENIDEIIEAILFALGREVSLEELVSTLNVSNEVISDSLNKIKQKYSKNSGIIYVEVKDKVQLVTNNKYYEYVSKFVENTKKQKLSQAAFEVLSIIAYNPKITKSQIEAIRGVNSDFAVGRLLECGLIEEVARLNLPGRPAAYSVTSEFLKSAGISNIDELPDFDEVAINDEQILITDIKND